MLWKSSFPTPSPNPGAQRDPEPTAEGATEGLCFSVRTGRQDSGTAAAAAASLQSPGAAQLSRANPEQPRAPGGRSPLQKENNPLCPGPASSEPRRDGSPAWASLQSALVRCPPGLPPSEAVAPPFRPHQSPQAALQRLGVCVCLCGGARGGAGPGTARGDPPGSDTGTAGLTGRFNSGAFKSPPKSPCPEQQHPSGSTQDPRDRANPKAASRTP